jgi:hypothetical protein
VYDSLSYDTPTAARVLALCLLDQAFLLFHAIPLHTSSTASVYIIEVEEPLAAEYHPVCSI